jgi:hypothetical protein
MHERKGKSSRRCRFQIMLLVPDHTGQAVVIGAGIFRCGGGMRQMDAWYGRFELQCRSSASAAAERGFFFLTNQKRSVVVSLIRFQNPRDVLRIRSTRT